MWVLDWLSFHKGCDGDAGVGYGQGDSYYGDGSGGVD